LFEGIAHIHHNSDTVTAHPHVTDILMIKTFMRSVGYALAGLGFACRNERNMRIHIAAASIVTPAGWYFELTIEEWRSVGFAIVLVVALEAVNTAIEQCCNAITTDFNPHIRVAKDVAAGAVLTAAIWSLFLAGTLIAARI
jgi:diacylglycerol kinase